MKSHEPDSVKTDDSLGTVLAACLEELDRGGADPESLLARYPEYAGELRELFADQARLELLAAPLRAIAQAAQVVDPADAATAPPNPLGDFRILREIGRGGMGVVYEAEQISLARRVALKVLPFAAALDQKRLQRFHNEARAVAQLHHSNIVPVFGVGCERGVHYYAMQFIEGQTVATIIKDLREQGSLKRSRKASEPGAAGSGDPRRARAAGSGDPRRAPDGAASAGGEPAAPDSTTLLAVLGTEHSVKDLASLRTVARLGVQAASALECAHVRGVVHRDIKPANLLVDAQGNLWITDFGLAFCQGQPGLTMTGDLVGTLRYMSPEQALAKSAAMDQRTDIYSLGATLYELLALQPVFAGDSREELLRQIAFEEPVPLRRLNKAIPAELETIIHKALEKNPGDRYASAQEFADDLQRHLQDEPIRARRPSLRVRAAKWARRHKPLVAMAASVSVMLLVGAVIAAWMYAV